MQNAKTKFKRKLQHFKLISQWVFTDRGELLSASQSQSFERENIFPRLPDWLTKVSELTEYVGTAISGIKLPTRCFHQEMLFLHFLNTMVRLREDMEFMHTTSRMLNMLKTTIMWTLKNKQLKLLIHLEKIKNPLLKEIIFWSLF